MSNNKLDNNTEMEIPVFETPPGPGSSAIKVEPKEENCEDLLSAFLLDPPSVKIENEVKGEDLDEFGTLSEDYTVNIEQLKAEQSEDSKEWLNKHPLKSEEKDQLPVGEDQDDDFVENPSIIKSEEMDIKEDESINEPGNSANSFDQNVFQCPDCKYTTTTKSHMNYHRYRHTRNEFPCAECDYKAINKRTLACHASIHRNSKAQQSKLEDENVLKCYHCSYKTADKISLKNHLFSHAIRPNTMRTFRCSECGYRTTWMHVLKDHLRLVHNIEDYSSTVIKFKCQNCNFFTNTKSCYTRHVLQKHKKGDFKTRQQRSSKVAVKKHLQLHESGSPSEGFYVFKCDLCDFGTNKKSSINRHVLQHEMPENDMLHCYACSYKTIDKSNLIRHMRRHYQPHHNCS